ncbi:uncharacterized protein PAC_08516 [Phialocephala subalpina]|uniref:Nephrocystin 3-like N-terminal domain-containing protein n=1 Tax=Phialocephala subalpina TaxID=576137 RepID=A0A1L7X0S1_9HELO|nr:uncharacterized protein PAC_08516 [Phialocephala subalpina]
MDNEDFVLVERHVTAEDLEKLRSWLSPTEFECEGSEYRKHLNAHVPGTGDWLFQTDKYKDWHNAENGALWIQGIPASGKSVVAANLVQRLKDKNAPVLFLFSRRIIKSNNDPSHLVRDCIYQFLDHSIALQAGLKLLMEQHSDIVNIPFHELWRILISALSTVPKVYVMLDALDELEVEANDFLRCLRELAEKKLSSIKLSPATSPLDDFDRLLLYHHSSWRTQGRERYCTYVTHRMASQQERTLKPEEQSTIKDALCQKSQGLFLYARLMVDEILQRSSSTYGHLQHLPGSLADMYVNPLHEHSARSGASLHFQSMLLSWVTHSSRPFRVSELAALINLLGSHAGLNDLQDAQIMSWSIDGRPTDIDSHGMEQQRHLMVQYQFLQYASMNLLYHAAKCDAADPDLASRLDSFFQYGSHDFESWKDFLFSKEGKNTPDGFHPLHLAASTGLTAYTAHLLRNGAAPDLIDSQGRAANTYCAIHGHAETLTTLLCERASFTIHDSDGLAPIHHAAKGNHIKVLQCLLDASADPVSPKSGEDSGHYPWRHSTIGKTPMQYACETGNAGIVSELLQRLSPLSRITILPHWASSTGQANVLSMLLQCPEILANINKKDSCRNTALYLAACVGDSSSVRILLHHRADVHSRSSDFYKVSTDIRKPLEYKVVSSGPGQTPLQGWAQVRRPSGCDGHHSNVDEWAKTASLLIEAGSDIEAKDEKGKTVLFSWIEQLGHGRGNSDRTVRFVNLLLKYGANPRTTDDEGSTPLHQGRDWYQNPGVIEAFTKGGANINHAREGDLATPLIAAARRQLKAVDVRAYIDNGAKPDMQDLDGNTALHHISKSWLPEFEDLQEWLNFADPTIKNNKGETCLYNLRWGNGGQRMTGLHLITRAQISNNDNGPSNTKVFSDIIDSIIKAGADINGVDLEGNTPLFDAITSEGGFVGVRIRLETILKFGGLAKKSNYRGQTALHKAAGLEHLYQRHYTKYLDLLGFLLQDSLGIDLHARDNEGLMTIHCAASTSEINNTWKFIQVGANIKAQANDGRNPLHFAAGAAKSNVVGLLCRLYREESWTVDQKDETGRTPLHYATCLGNSELVYYLLQSGVNPNIRDNQGTTPLHTCVDHNTDTANIRKQRKYERTLHSSDVPSGMRRLVIFMDKRKESPLHGIHWNSQLAILREEEALSIQDVVRLLLRAGADPAARNKLGQTAYDVAILLGSEELADVLSSLRQSSDMQDPLADQWYSIRSTSAERIVQRMDIENADAYMILQTAISLRSEAVFDALLKSGVDPTALGPDACAHHYLLIELGANVDTSYQEVDDEQRRSTGTPIPSYASVHILAMGEQWWNVSALDSLCKAGADLEFTDVDGNTALQCALNGKKSGSWGLGFWRDETLEAILRHGANINALSPENGSTPLIAALESSRSSKLIQRLLDYGTDITLGRKLAIFAAIENENPEALAAVVDVGADVNAVYHPETPKKWGRDPKVETPLLSAAINDGLTMRKSVSKIVREAIMTILLRHGANPLMGLQDGETTVIHQIASYHGIIAPILKSEVDLEIKDSQNRTPLLLACSPMDYPERATEDESTSRELILAGSSTHTTDNTDSTPLHLAAQAGLVKTVTFLLENGASASAKNKSGLSPLYYALSRPYYHEKLDLVNPLLSAGADPLFKALYQIFVDSGCEHDSRDDLGNTPLSPYVKAVKPRSEYVRVDPPAEQDVRQMFDDHDVLAVNYEGDTLLHAVAAREEDVETVSDRVWLFKELMARGIEPRRRNKKGTSALDVAAACGKQEILGLFAREE